ncbi:uncharacterized protein PG986_009651 [Apiospora aurea]|uniref:Uncharacterized protein n=1 Tax=Apiospora aurea TaxID=335848 RepID=A0ABR1Q8C3_9PEZI
MSSISFDTFQGLAGSDDPNNDIVWLRVIFLYTVVCLGLATYTRLGWNEHKHSSISPGQWEFQWLGFLLLFLLTLPMIPVLWGFQLPANACLRYGGTPSSNPSPGTGPVHGGPEGQKHRDGRIYAVEGRGIVHRGLVKFVGLPPLQAGVPSWAEQNCRRSKERRANEDTPLLSP